MQLFNLWYSVRSMPQNAYNYLPVQRDPNNFDWFLLGEYTDRPHAFCVDALSKAISQISASIDKTDYYFTIVPAQET